MSDFSENEHLERLLRQVAHIHFKRTHMYLEKIGLYKGQPRLLRLLWVQDGRTQKELAEEMNIQPATITKMVRRMQNAGFVVRKSDLEDMRVSRIFLTDSGRQIRKEVENIHQTLYEESLKDFTVEEKVLLRRFLMQIKENLLGAMGKQQNAKH
ncbi:MAG: MarR family transcriptional regulator [Firmicutes bacterium]|nr:MarR family transcriptional regulator [Bacillota bacterium]